MSKDEQPTEVVWEDPPEKPDRRYGLAGKYVSFFQALREHPGKWARFPTTSKSQTISTNIKRGQYAGSSSGEFTAVAQREDETREFTFWVRYVGDQ